MAYINGKQIIFSPRLEMTVDQEYNPESPRAQSGTALSPVINELSNALKGSKSGSAILIDDVSPVTHYMSVKVRNKNLLPPADSGIYYKGSISSGKPVAYNLPISDFSDIDLSSYRGVFAVIKLTEGETYTLLINNLVNNCETEQLKLAVGFRSSEDTIFETGERNNCIISADYNPSSLTFTVPSGFPYCLVGFFNYPTVSGDTVSFDAMQLEIGGEATDYTPYVDLTTVKVTRCGKNLLLYPFTFETSTSNGITFTDNKDGTITLNGQNNGTDTSTYNLFQRADKFSFLKPNIDYHLSCNLDNITLSLRTVTSEGSYKYYSYGNINFSSDETPNRLFIQIKNTDTAVYQNTILKVQLELGSATTDYEPYIGADYTPTADGTVEGVTSLYPNTTLTTDTDGVLIDCEYNRDINKAFAELQQAIISLGGNV